MFKFIFYVFVFFFFIALPFVFWYCYFYFVKGMRIKKGSYKYIGYGSFCKRLFWDFPRQFILDKFNYDNNTFREYGVHIIAGEQGSGKSITLTYLLRRYQKMYPEMVVKTNYRYVFENGVIADWRDVVASNNDIKGEIDVLDEIQNWFCSLQSKNFPPEMLTEITQQRKQRKCVFGTSQVFSRVAKPIREQTTFLYEPMTLFGCLTIVRVYKPKTGADGLVFQKKLRKIFFFVHSDDLRNSFDTYKKIESLSENGFIDRSEQIQNL